MADFKSDRFGSLSVNINLGESYMKSNMRITMNDLDRECFQHNKLPDLYTGQAGWKWDYGAVSCQWDR